MAGMTSVLLAAAVWLLLASKYGLPVSTTHSAVGGVIAFAISSRGYGSVNWGKVGMIVASWFISPALSGIFGFILYVAIRHFVLRHEDSFRRARIATPVMIFLMTLIVALFTIYKGAKGIGLHKTEPAVAIGIAVGISAVAAAISVPFIKWWSSQLEAQDADAMKKKAEKAGDAEEGAATAVVPAQGDANENEVNDKAGNAEKDVAVKDGAATGEAANEVEQSQVSDTERIFRCFVVVIAGFQSLAHGANDVANSVGPFGAVLAASAGELQKKSEIPVWVFIVAGLCIVIGLGMYGRHVMTTIGQNITPVTPSKAACAQWAATCVVLIATRTGIPVSTTHCAVGGVLGVGLADGVKSIDWKLMGKIFGSWILTLPLVGIASAGTYALFLPAVTPTAF